MCWCTPGRRTPNCGGLNCHPPQAGQDAIEKLINERTKNLNDTLTRTQAECTRLLGEKRDLKLQLEMEDEVSRGIGRQYMDRCSEVERLKATLKLYEASDKLVCRCAEKVEELQENFNCG